MADRSLTMQWAACGIAAAAARFVPVPVLDDVVRRRATQVAVARTLRAHGRTYSSQLLSPLWGEDSPRWGVRRLRAASARLLLFPVRKYTAVFGAVRGVPTDVMRLVLVARALDRRLGKGELADPDGVPQQAQALHQAVQQAIRGMDLRLLTAALADGLSQSRGLSTAAVTLARQRFARSHGDGEAPVEPEGPVADGAERITQVLDQPEVVRLLHDFDVRVDELLEAG